MIFNCSNSNKTDILLQMTDTKFYSFLFYSVYSILVSSVLFYSIPFCLFHSILFYSHFLFPFHPGQGNIG